MRNTRYNDPEIIEDVFGKYDRQKETQWLPYFIYIKTSH